jgi:hypothetical protein
MLHEDEMAIQKCIFYDNEKFYRIRRYHVIILMEKHLSSSLGLGPAQTQTHFSNGL